MHRQPRVACTLASRSVYQCIVPEKHKKAVGEAEKSPTASMLFLVTTQEALQLKKGIVILWATAWRRAMPTAAGAKTTFAHEFHHETDHTMQMILYHKCLQAA